MNNKKTCLICKTRYSVYRKVRHCKSCYSKYNRYPEIATRVSLSPVRENYRKHYKIYGKEIVQRVGNSLGKSHKAQGAK